MSAAGGEGALGGGHWGGVATVGGLFSAARVSYGLNDVQEWGFFGGGGADVGQQWGRATSFERN